MNFNFIPKKIVNAINALDVSFLTEIRLRRGCKISILYKGKREYINQIGIVDKAEAMICEEEDIAYIVNTVTERSIYAFNDEIKQGFLTTKDGVRIGIAGDCVFDGGEITTIKNFSSLNIRIPHEIINCSDCIFNEIFDGKKIRSALIISPPGCGKTTFLKDVARKLECTQKQIMIIDERGEFSGIVGENIDKIAFSDKLYAFSYGIRSLSPDVVITDELACDNDWICVKNAVNSGVKIIASCHGASIEDVKLKSSFYNGVFERYFVLNSYGKVGKLKYGYDGNFNLI